MSEQNVDIVDLTNMSSRASSATPPPPRSSHTPTVGTPTHHGDVSNAPSPENDASGATTIVVEPATESTTAKPSTTVKPKSTKAPARPRSPSLPPAPPPRPPAPLTVRLTVPLGGPQNYSINILELAKSTGQRLPTPPPVRRDSVSGSDDDDDDGPGTKSGKEGGNDAPAKRTRKKRADPDYYDVDDPFIDDSDLGVDAPTHFAQTKQKGFYVNSGDVSLVSSEVPKKPRKKRAPPGFVPSTSFLHKGKGVGSSKFKSFKPLGRSSLPPLTPRPRIVSTPVPASEKASLPPPLSSVGPSSAHTPDPPIRPPFITSGDGSRESPIALFDGPTSEAPASPSNAYGNGPPKRVKLESGVAGVKRQSTSEEKTAKEEEADEPKTNGESKKRKRSDTADAHQFSPELILEFDRLRSLVAQEDFTIKAKFPTSLREPLAACALKAVELGEHDENFFRMLPDIFPYNKFTMTKLVKRLIYDRHKVIIEQSIDRMIEELARLATEGFPAAKQAHEDEVHKWQVKKEKAEAKKEAEAAAAAGTPNGDATAAEGVNSSADAPGVAKREDKQPQQKYKWTDELRSLVWQVVTLSNEIAAMTNTMHEFEPDNHDQVSEQGMRKNLYQRIAACFPDGWMTTTAISREISVMKKKVQQHEGEQSE